MKLKYLGKGFLPGIPARDLSDKEVEQYGLEDLIRSGLYVEISGAKNATMEPDNKMVNPAKGRMENKNG